MEEKSILQSVEDLKSAREKELEAGKAMAEAKAKITSQEETISAHTRFIIAQAYNEEKIDGKNVETRKAQEGKVINDDQSLIKMSQELREINTAYIESLHKYDQAKIIRRYWEDMLSAQRAVLIAYGTARDRQAELGI